jgi:hypothetical protein
MPKDGERWTFGIEGFWDQYKEPDTFPDLENWAEYGALTVGYTNYFNPRWYATVEGRVSYGSEDYKSRSGYINDIPQWEFENRYLFGYHFTSAKGVHHKTYVGLGIRYYRDESKGEVTNQGSLGYDRRILQFYAPIGYTMNFPAFGFTMSPTIEFDPLIWGHVQSRLQNITGYGTADNYQDEGYGLRGEFLIGQEDASGFGWQFGPFVRWWDIEDSDRNLITTPSGPAYGREPANTRLQFGAKLLVSY